MSVVTEINRINANIGKCYNQAIAMGATPPEVKNSNFLRDTIATIPLDSNVPFKSAVVGEALTALERHDFAVAMSKIGEVDIFEQITNNLISQQPSANAYHSSLSPCNNYLAITQSGNPFFRMYHFDGTQYRPISVQPQILPGNGRNMSWNSDGSLICVAHDSTPFFTVYSRSGNTFTRLTPPTNLPTGNAFAVAFAPNSNLLCVTHGSLPGVQVYNIVGTTITRIATSPTLTGAGRSCCFSPTGDMLIIGYASSLSCFTVSGTTLTEITPISANDLPTWSPRAVKFAPNGVRLFVSGTANDAFRQYLRSGNTFQRLPDTTHIIPGEEFDFAFHDNILAIAHNAHPFLTSYDISGLSTTRMPTPAQTPAGDSRGVTFFQNGNLLVTHMATPFISLYRKSRGEPDDTVGVEIFRTTLLGISQMAQNPQFEGFGVIRSSVAQGGQAVLDILNID
jgi:WD40 repeat protein